MRDVVIPYNTMSYDTVKPPSNGWHQEPNCGWPWERDSRGRTGRCQLTEAIDHGIRQETSRDRWCHAASERPRRDRTKLGRSRRNLTASARVLAGRRSPGPRTLAAADRPAGHRQDDAGHGRGPTSQATAFYQPVHGGHASRGSDRHPCAGREWKDRLSCLAPGHGDDHRRSLRARRGEPDEREIVGQPGTLA